jgi:ribonuclease PH
MVDLDYSEDSTAEVDMNVVADAQGRIVEIQGTGEQRSFARAELDALVDLALAGIATLTEHQTRAVADVMSEVEAVLGKPSRRPAPAKDEKDLWGAP